MKKLGERELLEIMDYKLTIWVQSLIVLVYLA